MRTWTVILYFIIAIVLLASIGVSMPYIFDMTANDVNAIKNLNQNLVTYFIAILVSASLDLLLRLIDENVSYKKPAIMGIGLLNLLVFAMTAYILYCNSHGTIKGISTLAICGVIISYIMWWITNIKNPSFNVSSTLGGDTDKPVKNG